MGVVEIILAGLFAPAILFFALGILTALVKSDLEIPPAVSRLLAIYLLASIGLRGGAAVVNALKVSPGLLGVIVPVAFFAIICGAFFAFSTANILKRAGLKTADAWAAGGHYGAVSASTLAVAVGIATAAQEEAAPGSLIFSGWMPAMYPFMDSPALLTAIILGKIALAKEGAGSAKVDLKEVLHSSIFGMGVWLLVSSFLVGIISQTYSPQEMEKTMVFFDDMFRGVLALFLLDAGMAAGRLLGELKKIGSNLWKVILVALGLPQVWALVGLLGMFGINLLMPGMMGWGDAFVFAAIAGGCSYISAPAAMRIAFPEANPSVYISMSLAITFPFNIIVGMLLWRMVAMALWGAFEVVPVNWIGG